MFREPQINVSNEDYELICHLIEDFKTKNIKDGKLILKDKSILKHILKYLKEYRKWATGSETISQPNPKLVGMSIDIIIAYMNSNLQ